MILLDLFSGIGGFHKGLSDAGIPITKSYFSEIDKHATANYKYNFSNAEYIGSVTDVLNSGIERPDIITFGSPCQDFSLAGKRRGLGGERSSLIEYALSAISEFKPKLFIWENVKGTFSSNDSEDFWAIIKAFADIGGYGLEWQLVNTAWLLPQNRERIYLVGHLAAEFGSWKGVFPIGEDDFVLEKPKVYKREEGEWFKTTNFSGTIVNYGKCRNTDTYIMQKGPGFIKDKLHGICPTTRRGSFEHNARVIQLNKSKESGGRQPYQQNRIYDEKGLSPALDLNSAPKNVKLEDEDIIRRLTEIECERLQGFPDNWTKYGNYNGTVKQIAKTQRYKMLGNAVTAKMVELLGKRIKENL